jgi:polysaccharide transporter, PST family
VSYRLWRELARFGRHILVANGIYRLNVEGRTIEVGHWLGAPALGQYSMALRLGIQPFAVVVNGISYVLLPALARVADDPARFRQATLRSLRSVVLASVPLSLLLIPFGRPATVLLLGARWSPCGSALAWMAGIGIAGAADTLASEALKAAGRPEWLPPMHALRTAGVLAATGAFVGWGLHGAAFALSLGEVLAAAVGIVAIARVTGLRPLELLRPFAVPAAGGAALLAAALPLRLALDPANYTQLVGIPLVVGEALVGLGAYAAVVAMLEPAGAAAAGRAVRGRLGRRAPAE